MQQEDYNRVWTLTEAERRRLLHAYETLVHGLDENITPDQEALMLCARDDIYRILKITGRCEYEALK